MRASRAFTLVELLVAIGVIAILAALVLSVFSRTRVTTQAISCRNNLRQWGLASHLFAADHNDYPAAGGKANADGCQSEQSKLSGLVYPAPGANKSAVLPRHAVAYQSTYPPGKFNLDLSGQSPPLRCQQFRQTICFIIA